MGKSERVPVLLASALGVLLASALWVFWPLGRADFISLDDPAYVYNNFFVRGGFSLRSLAWAFTTFAGANWHPLTWLSHLLDVTLFGLEPGAHHLVSVGLHLANTLLAFLAFNALTGSRWRSLLVAALFALHPLHVESVAWVAERKDLLSALFWFLTLLAYARYVRRPGLARYLLVALCFALGLLAKPMLVSLPLVLLLVDFWPLGRWGPTSRPGTSAARGWGALALEKAPLVLLAALSSVVTVIAQVSFQAVAPLDALPFGARVANAIHAYARYLGKLAWPSRLAVLYPGDPSGPGLPQAAAALALVALLTGLAAWQWRRRPWLAVGWLWFAGTLVPVIGLVQVGAQSMADRYTYLPALGIFVAVAWLLAEVASRSVIRRTGVALLVAAWVAALSLAARSQVARWRDSFTIFPQAIENTAANWQAHYFLAQALLAAGKSAQALPHYARALEIKPTFAGGQYSMAVALEEQGDPAQAENRYRRAIQLQPDYAVAHNNLAILLAARGDRAAALDHYLAAVRSRPDFADGHFNLGLALAEAGRREEAAAHLTETLRLRPDHGAARAALLRLR